MRLLFAVAALSTFAAAQPPAGTAPTDVQREAMKKLQFLVGQWKGSAVIAPMRGEAMELTQTEDVQMKLDGLLMTIEGRGTDDEGKVRFQAFATVAYDSDSKTYRFRAYNEGRYLDTDLIVAQRGFIWSLDQGPAHIVNTMKLTDVGDWSETTGVKIGAGPVKATVSMTLKKQG